MTPLNAASLTNTSFLNNNPSKDALRFINSSLLLDSGYLYTDLITKDIADFLKLDYKLCNKGSDKNVLTANGKGLAMLGRVVNPVYIYFSEIPNKIFSFKPTVATALSSPAIICPRFMQKYDIINDAPRNRAIFHNYRKGFHAQITLHSSEIRNYIKVMNRSDSIRQIRCQEQFLETSKTSPLLSPETIIQSNIDSQPQIIQDHKLQDEQLAELIITREDIQKL